MTDNNSEWLETVRRELVRSVDDIDAATRSRLTQIRQQAQTRKAARKIPAYGLPAAALATACLVLAIVVYIPKQQPDQYEMINDLDLITTSESLELFEDLEFYEWLEVYDLPG